VARRRVAEPSPLVLSLQAIRMQTLPLPVRAVKAVKRAAVAQGVAPVANRVCSVVARVSGGNSGTCNDQ
jgi:hypothetical protein